MIHDSLLKIKKLAEEGTKEALEEIKHLVSKLLTHVLNPKGGSK